MHINFGILNSHNNRLRTSQRVFKLFIESALHDVIFQIANNLIIDEKEFLRGIWYFGGILRLGSLMYTFFWKIVIWNFLCLPKCFNRKTLKCLPRLFILSPLAHKILLASENKLYDCLACSYKFHKTAAANMSKVTWLMNFPTPLKAKRRKNKQNLTRSGLSVTSRP